MKKQFNQVYQFKITLKEVKPPIWRRIQVPETYSFYDLHVAIQDAMGWSDSHLHQFEMNDPSSGNEVEIGIPDEDFADESETLPGWKQKIADYFSLKNPKAEYVYDFGDNWEHIVQLEKILPREEKVSYPVCIDGKRACPPDDCGGVWGYMNLLETISNPDDEEYEDMIEWLGGEFDPEQFDPDDVFFDDPTERKKLMSA